MLTLEAGVDLSASKFHFVTVSSGKFALAGAGERGWSVQEKAALGEFVPAMTHGQTKVVAGAAIALDADVTSDASGKAVTAVSGNEINGKALEAATAADQIITILVHASGARAA